MSVEVTILITTRRAEAVKEAQVEAMPLMSEVAWVIKLMTSNSPLTPLHMHKNPMNLHLVADLVSSAALITDKDTYECCFDPGKNSYSI